MGSTLPVPKHTPQEEIRMKNIFLTSLLFSAFVSMTWARGCHTELKTVYKTEYKETEEEKCETINEEWCNEVCKPHHTKECKPHKEEKCTWEKHTECQDVSKWIDIPYEETECEKKPKKVCEYEWQNTESGKIWAEIPGTCKFEDEEECKNVEKTREKEVTEKICTEVPKKKCKEVEVDLCTTKKTQKCEQECKTKPKKHCEKVHRKIPVQVSKKEKVTSCKYPAEEEKEDDYDYSEVSEFSTNQKLSRASEDESKEDKSDEDESKEDDSDESD